MGPPTERRIIVREMAKPRRGLVTGTALLAAFALLVAKGALAARARVRG
jgi:hypothetical protein